MRIIGVAGPVVLCALVLPTLLWIGREQWFFADEWSFLVDRGLSRPGTLLESHNGHWVTAPVLLYRLNFDVFGLHTYLPYQVPVVLAHLAVVALVFALSRRLGARSWIALGTSAALVAFGTGSENILYGFQVTLTGALACGLAHLLLADRDGPASRRDALGVAIGAVGLMSSGVGVAMVLGVAVAVWLRRGWPLALLHAAPLAAVYGVWFGAYGYAGARTTTVGAGVVSFVTEMTRAGFDGLGRWRAAALALGAVAVIGIAAAARVALRVRAAAPVALPAGLVAALFSFATLTGVARARLGGAASGRYAYVVAALALPLVAAGAEALARHRAWAGALPLVLLAAAAPWNADRLANRDRVVLGSRDLTVALAHSPLLSQVPPRTRYLTSPLWPGIGPTAAWLRTELARGRIPGTDGIDDRSKLTGDLVAALRKGDDDQDPRRCGERPGPVRRRVAAGDVVRFSGPLRVTAVRDRVRSATYEFRAAAGTIDVLAGPLTIELAGVAGAGPTLCTAAGGPGRPG